MEATSVASLPEGNAWQYEPKWDGFRCLAFKDSDQIELQSKSGKLLTRCFPEIVEALRRLPAKSLVLDGELVIPVEGELSFDHLLMRLTQSAARAKKLAAEHPAVMFVFDLLADGSGELIGEPLSKRRPRLEQFAAEHLEDNGTLRLSPVTTDIAVARKWLALAGGSLDGVVAKRLDLPYQSGESRGMQKIKRLRTVDCVVGGITYSADKRAVSYLHLGLYEDGLLNFVGSAPLPAAAGKRLAPLIEGIIEPPGFTGKMPGELRGQFGKVISEWHPLLPSIVAEVQYDHFTGGRFRHGAKFRRWRPDKEAAGCTLRQVLVAP
jgi:ATP-dependent DNA ligase